jgi:hypothetical protein
MSLEAALRLAGSDAPCGIAYRTELGDIHSVRVRGADGLAIWERLRANASDTGHWPLLANAREGHDPDDYGVLEADVVRRDLRDGEALDVEEWFATRRRPDPVDDAGEAEAALIAARGAELDAAGESGLGASLSVLEEWNGTGVATPELVWILLVPTATPWHVPAYLQMGRDAGEPDMPEPPEHVAVLKHWYERYGAEPVAFVDYNVIELRPLRRPTSAQAPSLAREVHAYSPWTVEALSGGTLSQARLAAHLRTAPFWHFWWD